MTRMGSRVAYRVEPLIIQITQVIHKAICVICMLCARATVQSMTGSGVSGGNSASGTVYSQRVQRAISLLSCTMTP